MRIAALISVAALAFAGAAAAQVPTVSVSIGPKLQAKADEYGARELDFLARDLARTVEKRIGGAPGRYELTLVNAKPSRPTVEQMSDMPGLSMESFGLGGAEIAGDYIAADGSRTPISFRWYENDIRWAQHNSTWADAEYAFDKLAANLASGRLYARR